MFKKGTLDVNLLTLIIFTHLTAMFGLAESGIAVMSRAQEVATAMIEAENIEAFDKAYDELGSQ
jgi:hypothetical protein